MYKCVSNKCNAWNKNCRVHRKYPRSTNICYLSVCVCVCVQGTTAASSRIQLERIQKKKIEKLSIESTLPLKCQSFSAQSNYELHSRPSGVLAGFVSCFRIYYAWKKKCVIKFTCNGLDSFQVDQWQQQLIRFYGIFIARHLILYFFCWYIIAFGGGWAVTNTLKWKSIKGEWA